MKSSAWPSASCALKWNSARLQSQASAIRRGAWPALNACVTALALGLLLVCVPGVHAAVVLASSGQVRVEHQGFTVSIIQGQSVGEGDELRVAADAELVVRFDDGARLAVRPNSRVFLKRLSLGGTPESRHKTLRIIKGGIRYISGESLHKDPVAFETRTASIGIRGTDVEIAVTDDAASGSAPGTYPKVNTGRAVLAGLDGTELELAPGELAFGAEPERMTRGVDIGAARQPSARRVEGVPSGVFKSGELDHLLR